MNLNNFFKTKKFLLMKPNFCRLDLQNLFIYFLNTIIDKETLKGLAYEEVNTCSFDLRTVEKCKIPFSNSLSSGIMPKLFGFPYVDL